MLDRELTSTERQACDEALKRIAECGRRRSPVLNLSGLGLSILPAAIGQLAKLTELDASNNHLAALPPEIGQSPNLLRLDLSHNRLTALPQEIGQLAKLQSCDISNNPLTALPPAISRLACLTRLDVSNNTLANLPQEIGNLVRLTRLYLAHNRLTSLPSAIGQLACLTRLYLAHNRLESLPAETGQLASLTRLDLSNNMLESLPGEIGQLAKLTVLDLSENRLTGLPAELGQLAKLTVLWLGDNRLAVLPESLAELENLESLCLHGNPALHLSPAVLGADPRNTAGQASRLPGQTGFQPVDSSTDRRDALSSLTGGTPVFPTPRPASAKSILEFYFARLSGRTRPVNEARLILLGPAGSGKTSIVQAMRDLPFHEREESTPGIALSDMLLEPADGVPVTVHAWDFSGQEITRPLHPYFFSGRALYVVVLSGRDRRERDDAEQWLRLIRDCGADEHGNLPPVIVAMNQWNVPGCRPEVDRNALRDRYPFIRGFVEMDCKTKKGIPVLKAALCRELERMPWVREPFPDEWHAVRHTLAAGGNRWTHLTADAFRTLCADHGVRDQGQQDYLADFLHHLGTAVNFTHHPLLRDDTTLNPEWLTKHIYTLRQRAQLQAGILTRADLDLSFYQETDIAARDCLIRFLETIGVARETHAESGGLLVPAALPDNPPAPIDEFRNAEDATRFRYVYPSLPDSLIARLAARRFDFIEVVRERRQLWRHGLVLLRKGTRALVRTNPQTNELAVTVLGPNKLRRQFAALIRTEMGEIHAEIPCLDSAEEILSHGQWTAAPARREDPAKNTGPTLPANSGEGLDFS